MSGTESYWVHISRGGKRLGAGFLLMGSYVLTADHCVKKDGLEGVDVEFENGEVFPGRIHRRCPEADLALIDVPESGRGPVTPRGTRPSAGEMWRSPYPSSRGVFLSGMIDAVRSRECAAGGRVEAMQLDCKQDLGDYGGYSGSPIESDGADENKGLFGVLIEQYPRDYEPRPTSDVLFATTLKEVFGRFDCFALDHLMDELSSSSRSRALVTGELSGKPAAAGLAVSNVQSELDAADAKLEWLDARFRRGLLDEQQFTALTMQVMRLHLLAGGGGSSRE